MKERQICRQKRDEPNARERNETRKWILKLGEKVVSVTKGHFCTNKNSPSEALGFISMNKTPNQINILESFQFFGDKSLQLRLCESYGL